MINKGVIFVIYRVKNLSLDIHSTNQGISTIKFIHSASAKHPLTSNNRLIQQCLDELNEYLEGKRTVFTVPIDLTTGTLFQKEVWNALLTIPYGSTCSYKDLSHEINRPKAYQAIGQACKKNPIPIIIPCHRVISQTGQLTGYFGASEYGLSIKQSLITLEKGNQS